MTVDFKSLPDSARIWIYQSNRSFSPDELAEITQKTKEFLEHVILIRNEAYTSPCFDFIF